MEYCEIHETPMLKVRDYDPDGVLMIEGEHVCVDCERAGE